MRLLRKHLSQSWKMVEIQTMAKTEDQLNHEYAKICFEMGDCTIKMVGLTKRHDQLMEQFQVLAGELQELEETKRKNAASGVTNAAEASALEASESLPQLAVVPDSDSSAAELACQQ